MHCALHSVKGGIKSNNRKDDEETWEIINIGCFKVLNCISFFFLIPHKQVWYWHKDTHLFLKIFLKDFIYSFLERGEEQENERERIINVWLPLVCPVPGAFPATQACALTGNRTCDPLASRLGLNPLSHTSQDQPTHFFFFN